MLSACCPVQVPEDSVESFTDDVVRSSKRPVTDLVTVLTSQATDGLRFLRERVRFNLANVGQLGGHSHPRTHFPSEGLVGQEIIMAMQRIVKDMAKSPAAGTTTTTTATAAAAAAAAAAAGRVQLLFKSHVKRLLTTTTTGAATTTRVTGVEFVSSAKGADAGAARSLRAHAVLLATGGYANDHEADSLLDEFRPNLGKLPTTNNKFSTGDGVKLARAVGAGLVDMDKVQVHPTAFVDPKHPDKVVKTLCAEILRGVGALLLHPRTGRRFVNELGRRNHVTDTMIALAPEDVGPEYVFVVNPRSAEAADKHIALYTNKGLMRRFDSLAQLAAAFNLPAENVTATIREYVDVAKRVLASGGEGDADPDAAPKADEFGTKFFHHVDGWAEPGGPFFAGVITPAVHYTMGGVVIDAAARVLRAAPTGDQNASAPVPGLFAAGEVVGGIHGVNRLGGNALTEALVFGRVAAKSIVAQLEQQQKPTPGSSSGAAPASSSSAPPSSSTSPGAPEAPPMVDGVTPTPPARGRARVVSREELAAHVDDAWVQIGDVVYDFSEFLEEHPAGPEAIQELAGGDGTRAFLTVHTLKVLEDFEDVVVGKILVEPDPTQPRIN
jgi:flavocytochrome c